MIIGSCPYEGCKGDVWVGMAEKTPAFSKDTCEECGNVRWHYHSRWEPLSYTEEGFLEEYSVDEDTKEITKN